MSQPAEIGEYSSTVERLRTLIDDLRELAESRLGIQKNPSRLWNLLDAISAELSMVCATAADQQTRAAARDRELQFDEVVDPIIDHLARQYHNPTEASEEWAHSRRNLRAELDNLYYWTSTLADDSHYGGSASSRQTG